MNLKQVSNHKSKKVKAKADPPLQIEPLLLIVYDKETLELERRKKTIDRIPGYYIDTRGLYPPFKVDKDCFFLCDYPDPQQNNKPCNKFFGAPKSINAHYSRVHNKDKNPNIQRRKLQ